MILLDRALEQHLYSQVITWVDASYDYIEELDRVNPEEAEFCIDVFKRNLTEECVNRLSRLSPTDKRKYSLHKFMTVDEMHSV